ncbi:hypothetical protein [Cupriavidus necator]|uniref:hypothetical protein n=1 Tax=Cupriavidus necator TaxID=106590 RepID=UPI0018929939|nr:hypothetical protein [Cupriavidus necator]
MQRKVALTGVSDAFSFKGKARLDNHRGEAKNVRLPLVACDGHLPASGCNAAEQHFVLYIPWVFHGECLPQSWVNAIPD